MAAWLQTLSALLASAATQRERAQSVYGPDRSAVPISGSVTVTWMTHDDSGLLSVGDVGDRLLQQLPGRGG